ETNSIQVYNPTFIVPRKDGRLRKILDCRRINFFTKHVHFKMDGPEQLRQILQQSDYSTILDIKEAFHDIHVHLNFKQFLGFKFKNRSYTYLGLPIGWNLSPFFFSKTLAIAIRAIKTKWKIKIQHYMDDIILINHSKNTLKQTMQVMIRFLQNIGQRLSPNMCDLKPKMTFQYLGFMASSFQQLERTSCSFNLAKKSITNINRLGNEIHSPQDGQYNSRVYDMQMECSNRNSTSGERDFSFPQQFRYNDQNGTSSRVGELDGRCIEQPVMDRRLPNQPSSPKRNTSVNQFPTQTGRLRPQNNQVVEMILFTIRRQQSNRQNGTEHSMDQRATSPTTPIGLITKVIQKMISDQVEAVLILPRWKDNEKIHKFTTRNHRDDKDKYNEGEQLYRELEELTRLDSTAIDQLIAGINPETWRKRRAGLTPLANYLKQNNINTSILLGNKPDVELVNALAWYKDRGGPKLQKRMKNMKLHCGVVLSLFSQTNDINNSSLVKTYSKGQDLSIQSKPRIPTM
ncbi:MAG: hypothetical protein EZS28_010104, partial [Streblomastix strix]